MKKNLSTWVVLTIILLLPAVAMADCTCDPEGKESGDTKLALKYKWIAFAAIMAAGAFGVCFPMLGRRFNALGTDKNFFFVLKAFASGVILATGFIHVLPDAFESLTSPCIVGGPWAKFPFTGLFAMVAAIMSLLVESFARSYSSRRAAEQAKSGGDDQSLPVHTHATHGHAHGMASFGLEDELLRHRVVSQVLELGIVVHSVIIGIALGASESPETIRPLITALSFHQLFEGIGLGGCVTQAKYKNWKATIMAAFFTFTTPIGIVIGILITKVYSETSPTALIVQGALNSASAGILIYTALVDLLSADFTSPRMQQSLKLQLLSTVALLLGAGCMSLLAIWA